ncbi:MAG: hypothetical protein FJ304_05465 [Planctomycetes bacterium]|nr:hypothetical protein [Planctomycetota bacterium]
MGGLGSGARYSKKDTVEECRALDTADLKRWNLLVPGTTNWAGSFRWGDSSVSYRLTVGADAGTLRLMYRMTGASADLDYPVRLVTTRCHLGGARWWFLCPLTKDGTRCGRRARKLYLCGRYFGCRRCHDLTYRSRQESDARVYALARAGLSALPTITGASVAQLGVALRALTVLENRMTRRAR